MSHGSEKGGEDGVDDRARIGTGKIFPRNYLQVLHGFMRHFQGMILQVLYPAVFAAAKGK